MQLSSVRRWVDSVLGSTTGIYLAAAVFAAGAVIWWGLRRGQGDAGVPDFDAVRDTLAQIGAIGAWSGVAAMAVVQFWKALTPARGRFHIRFVERHFHGPLGKIIGGADGTPTSNFIDYEWQWNGAAEQVVGQLSQIAQFVIARPVGRDYQLKLLAGPFGELAVSTYVESLKKESDDTAVQDAAFDVRHFVEQNLDSLLLRMRSRWQRHVRLQASLLSMTIGLLSALSVSRSTPVVASCALSALCIGGFFAWFARDIVAVIEKWRS